MALHIFYCSSPCGSGKTYQLVARACAMAQKDMVAVIVQPTIDLINKTINEELLVLDKPPVHHMFHSESVGEGQSVSRELTEYLKDPQDCGQIIFITHSVLPFIKYWPNQSSIHLLIDEDLQVVRQDNLNLPHNHHFITDDIEIVRCDSAYGKVLVQDEDSIDQKSRNKDEDDIYRAIQEPVRIIANPYWDSYVDQKKYDKVLKGSGELSFHSMLQPHMLAGFGSVFVTAAMFEKTAMYQLWSKAGVKFIHDEEFAAKLRYPEHQNGFLVTIYYATEHQWSKRFRDKPTGEQAPLDLLLAGAQKLFGERNFVWQANSDFKRNPFGEQGIRLPNKPHGLNAYSHLHDMVFVSALNPQSDHIKFLNSRGLSSEQIRACIYFATCYQAIMRISTRDPSDTNPKRILVPDLGLGEYLQEWLPGSKLEWLDVGIPKCPEEKKGGRKRKHGSNAARVAEQRRQARQKILDEYRSLLQRKSQDRLQNGQNTRAETPIEFLTSIGTAVAHGSLFANKKQSLAFGYLVGDSIDSFVELMEVCHQYPIPNKEGNLLISPAIFDPALSDEHDRGTENVVYLRHVWLDFDAGDLKPAEFPKLFPGWRMVVINTYSHTAECPRYRVIIPTTEIMTPEIYRNLQRHIGLRLEEEGYRVWAKSNTGRTNSLRSGLDTGKQAATSLFHLPSQAEVQKDSFFQYYDGEGREFLNPSDWFENADISIVPERDNHDVPSDWSGPINQADLEVAIAKWQTTSKGHGNEAFFQLAVDLRDAGMGETEIKATLLAQAQFGRSRTERKSEISNILKNLRKSKNPLKD